MQFSAAQIAALIQGKLEGDPEVLVDNFGKIEEAQAGQLAFLANPKYEEFLYSTKASIIIINESQVLKEKIKATLLRVPDAYLAFASLLSKYQEMMNQQLSGIQEPVYISKSASLGENVYVGAFSYIGNHVKLGENVKIYPQVYIGDDVSIGNQTVIYPGVKIYHRCVIGQQVTIHAGSVIGADGFGFAPQSDGSFKKIPQMGNVVIEDFVEVGSNATIDRATIGSTLIKSGAKLDNLIQIAHNVEIGSNTVIAAQSGVSGSTKLGNNVMVGGQVGIVGHIQIADGSRINAQSGVTKSLKSPNSAVTGSPAFEYTSALRAQAAARKLPAFEKRIIELEKLIQQLLEEKV
ncbi:MAG TPA: UDP-3-O-(3-hydroxymyristoyl)glucosamine N-acyltransferase [Chitinophagaceae bacterium]|jgi:UDP-3-O-[3-hydroxymyristoyl] glucosamine N-acyltransferase|nr:UDP-3-O-(3-hydroxymyristoyl)glucosamine N-acyltransferase [Chitinophagaceae bacterium]